MSTNWNTSTNWTHGVPSSTTDAFIGDSNFTGSYAPRLSSQSNCRSLSVGGAVAAAFTVGDRNLTVWGNVLINSNGSISHGKGLFSVKGNWTNNGSYATTKNQATVYFAGSGIQNVGGSSTTPFKRLTVGASSHLTCSHTFSAGGGGSSIIVNGIFDPGSIQVTGSASLTVNSGGVLIVTTPTFSGNFGTTGSKILNAGSLVNYGASATQTLDQTLSYSNLTCSGSGTKNAGGILTIRKDLTITSGVTFSAGNYTHTISGNINNAGTLNPGGSTVVLNGTSSTSIAGVTTFNILTISRSSSAINVILFANINVATLNMTLGSMLTGNNSVTITSARSGTGIIIGTITRQHTFSSGNSYPFEGPNNTITFTGASGINSVTVIVKQSPPTDFPSAVSINREYTIQIPGGSFTSATLRLHYLDAELNVNQESTLSLWHQDTAWNVAGRSAGDTVNNWAEKSGITALAGNWTLTASNLPNIARWTGSFSSAWEDSLNWEVISGNPGRPPAAGDVVELGTGAFINQPTINSTVSVRGITFGSTQPVMLALASGGSLNTAGNVSGLWSDTTRHTIQTSSQALSIGGNLLLSDSSLGHTISLTIGSGSVTVLQSLFQSGDAAITFTGAGQLTIGGDFNFPSGSFSPGPGTVTYNGSGTQRVAAGITYNNLIINKPAGTAAPDSAVNVSGDVTVTGAGTFLVPAPLSVRGSVIIDTNATLDGSSAVISLGGNWRRIGTFISGAGEVVLNGSGSESVDATTFSDLMVNKPAGIAAITGNILLNGDLSLLGGTLNLSGYSANDNTGNNTFRFADGSTLQIGGLNNFPANYAITFIGGNSTTEYNGSSAQNVDTNNTFGNLTLTNASTKSIVGSTSVAGNLLINPGAILNGGLSMLEVQGNWTNLGTFTSSAGAVLLDGLAAQIVGGSDTTIFYDLVINNSNGVSFTLDQTINDTLTMLGGNILTGTYAVCLTPTGNFSRTSGWVLGNTRKNFATGTFSFTFQVGDTFSYTPVAISGMNVTAAGYIAVSVRSREHPAIVSSAIDFNKDVNRYWTMIAGPGFGASAYNATFQYVSSDVDAGATPVNFIVSRYFGSHWFSTAKGTATDTTIQMVQDSSFGDFVAGELRVSTLLALGVKAGWNLLSVPELVYDPRLTSMFPVGTMSPAFSYAGSYVPTDSLFAGKGYWVRFDSARPFEVAGTPVTAETLHLAAGWNMIGTVSDTVFTSHIVSQPPSIITSPFFRYNGSYQVSDTLLPWFGYWIKLTQSGQFIISSGPGITPGFGQINIQPTGDLPPPPPGSDISHDKGVNPDEFALGENFPNPFNPSTVIRYQLPVESLVRLEIFNILGSRVMTLIDGVQGAGYRQVEWNASDVASGVYFYRLAAVSISGPGKTFTSVKKMLLVR